MEITFGQKVYVLVIRADDVFRARGRRTRVIIKDHILGSYLWQTKFKPSKCAFGDGIVLTCRCSMFAAGKVLLLSEIRADMMIVLMMTMVRYTAVQCKNFLSITQCHLQGVPGSQNLQSVTSGGRRLHTGQRWCHRPQTGRLGRPGTLRIAHP